MKQKIFIIFLLLFLQVINTFGLPTYNSTTRSKSMGNAFTSVSKDIEAIYYNPAGIGNVAGLEIFGGYTSLYPGVISSSILNTAISFPIWVIDDKTVISVVGLSFTGFYLKDLGEDEEMLGTITFNAGKLKFIRQFGFKDILLGIQFGIRSLQYKIDDYVINDIFENKKGKTIYPINAGLISDLIIPGLKIGFVVKNILMQDFTIISTSDKQLPYMSLGLSYNLNLKMINILTSIDGVYDNNKQYINSGIEFAFNKVIFLQSGVSFGLNKSFVYTFGTGIKLNINDYKFILETGGEIVPQLLDISGIQTYNISIKITL